MADLCSYTDEELHFHHSRDESPRDEDFPMHVHDRYELYGFLDGEASYLIEGLEYRLTPGCMMLMRPAESHKVKIRPSKPYERFSIHFSPRILSPIDPEGLLLEPFEHHILGQNNQYFPEDIRPFHPTDFLNAMCAPAASPQGRKLLILSYLYPLLGQLRAAFLQKNTADREQPAPSLPEQLVGYINRHLAEELSLPRLSREFYLSASQLNRLFKQSTGSSIGEYIQIKRLMAAQAAIREGASAASACQRCGFRDYSVFYRAYRKQFGLSPKQDKISWGGSSYPSQSPA